MFTKVCFSMSKYLSWASSLPFCFSISLFRPVQGFSVLFYFIFSDACLFSTEREQERVWILVGEEVERL